MVSFFTSPEDLAAKVAAAVHVAGALTDATDASFDLASVVGQDVIDRPEMLFNQSYLPSLIKGITELGDSPLLKIDLRDGRYWWSTRLYALATLADEYTAVEWLLFLDHGTDYVGMIRPGDLRWALALAQPELEKQYRQAPVPPLRPGMGRAQRAAQVLNALTKGFAKGFKVRPGGEERFRFLVDSAWITQNVRTISRVKVERSEPFDPLATHQLLEANTPFVPITKGKTLLKVVDRVGVATAIALTVVERRLGRT
jgi:hypothetical protein